MSERPLKSRLVDLVRVSQVGPRVLIRAVFLALGVFFVVYGAANIVSRIAHASFGSDTNAVIFGSPAASFQPLQGASSTSTQRTEPLTPARLRIPSIGVDANVLAVGNTAQGAMQTPGNFYDVAWYKLGSKPGEAGNAVIDGHVNNALTKAGVFEHLDQVKKGDEVLVSDASGGELRFVVRDVEDYPEHDAPLSVIFSRTGPPQLVLVTCDGDWDPIARSYDHRLIVFASLAS